MRPGCRFPVGDVSHEDAGAHHILQAAAQRLQGAFDLIDDEMTLRRRIRAADRPAAMSGGGAGDPDPLSLAHRPAEAGDRFPFGAAEHDAAAIRPGYRRIRSRHRFQVMAEVAGGGQEGGLAVFVAAVAGDGAQSGQRGGDCLPGGGVERELEQAQVILHVGALSQPRPDDHSAHRRLLQDIAAGHIGDGNPVAFSHLRQGAQERLEGFPAAGGVDEALVFHLRPGLQAISGRFRFPQPALAQESPRHRSEGQQLHPMALAQFAHRPPGALVDQRIAHLVGHHFDAAVHHDAQVGGVEIGQAELADQAGLLELLQPIQAIQPVGIGIVPGVELQQVDPLHLQAVECPLHRGAHIFAGHRARRRHPLGQQLHLAGFRAAAEGSGNDLRRAVMVGHVKGAQPGGSVGRHRRRSFIGIELAAAALHIGDLPQPGQHPGDPETRC